MKLIASPSYPLRMLSGLTYQIKLGLAVLGSNLRAIFLHG